MMSAIIILVGVVISALLAETCINVLLELEEIDSIH